MKLMQDMYKKISDHWIICSALLFFVLYVILSVQGFPSADDGYVLVAYQNVFSDPLCASYLFDRYLTVLIGGFWNVLFGWGGVFSFRVFFALFLIAAYIIVCYSLKDYWSDKYGKYAIFFAFFFVMITIHQRYGSMVFHYITLSAFNLCLMSFFLLKAFKKESLMPLCLSAIVSGINIFARVPNVLLCGLPFVVIGYHYWIQHDRKLFLRQICTTVLGIAIGIAIVYFFMVVFGHTQLFLESIEELQNVAKDSGSTHGVLPMLKLMFNHVMIVKDSILMILLVTILAYYSAKMKNLRHNQRLILAVLGVIALWFAILRFSLYNVCYRGSYSQIALIYAFIILMLGVALIISHKRDVVFISLLCLFSMFIQPIGSDGYLANMGAFSIWAALPYSLVIFIYAISQQCRLKEYGRVLLLFFISLLLIGPFNLKVFAGCFRDQGHRFNKIYLSQGSKYATFYTTQEIKEELDFLLLECKRYGLEGHRVMCGTDQPVINYLTNTKPFTGHPWPRIMGAQLFERKLNESLGKYGYPVIIEYEDGRADESYMESRNVLTKFIHDNGYDCVYCRNLYRIYIRTKQ